MSNRFPHSSDGSLLVRGGTAVVHDREVVADILIRDGRIVLVGQNLDPDLAPHIDAGGLSVLPGAIDPHVHFGWPGAADGFAEGSRAAACGGITSVLEYAIQFPGDRLVDAVDTWRTAIRDAVVDVGLHVIASDSRTDTLNGVREVMAAGVTSVKMFMTSRHSGGLGISDASMFVLMQTIAAEGGLAMAHCENDSLIEHLAAELTAEGHTSAGWHRNARPDFVESEAVGRAVTIAAAAGCPFYIPHLSSAAGLRVVEQAQSGGGDVLAETCPQFLALTDEVYTREHAERWVMSPPIKSAVDQQRLWEGLIGGSIGTVGSDHCPYDAELKAEHAADDFRRVPNGVPGVETLLVVLHHFGVNAGRITMADLARITAGNPARTFGLTTKGSIAPGKDGDLVLFDRTAEMPLTAPNLHSNIDFSIYDMVTVVGRPVLTIGNGLVLARDGQPVDRPPNGRFLPRPRYRDRPT